MIRKHSVAARARLAAVGVITTVMLAGCSLPLRPTTAAALTPDQVFARAKPTLVLVQVDYSAKITLPTPDVGDPAIKAIRAKLQARYDAGGHPELLNHDSYVAAFDSELYGNPGAYFSPGKDVTTQDGEVLELNGSGFVASETGFIATSAHVVATKDDEIHKKISDEVLKALKDGFPAAALSNSKRTPEQLQKFQAFYESYSAKYLRVENQTKQIHVALARGTPGKPLKTNGIPATVVQAGEPIPGKDVAILKIDPGANKLPSLKVGDEGMLKPAEVISAIGYPGDSIFRDQATDPRQVEPTLTHGAYQKGTEPQHGYDALGTEATIQEGESGGPMVDARGNVVGVIAFGIADKDGKIIPNLGFGVPASVVKEYLDKARAGAAESQTETEYRIALAEFDQKHYRTALPLLRDVKARWRDHPYVDAFIADSEKGIVDKADRTPPSTGELAAWGGGGAVVLLLLVVLLWFVVHRYRVHRRLVAQLAAAHGGGGGAGVPQPESYDRNPSGDTATPVATDVPPRAGATVLGAIAPSAVPAATTRVRRPRPAIVKTTASPPSPKSATVKKAAVRKLQDKQAAVVKKPQAKQAAVDKPAPKKRAAAPPKTAAASASTGGRKPRAVQARPGAAPAEARRRTAAKPRPPTKKPR